MLPLLKLNERALEPGLRKFSVDLSSEIHAYEKRIEIYHAGPKDQNINGHCASGHDVYVCTDAYPLNPLATAMLSFPRLLLAAIKLLVA